MDDYMMGYDGILGASVTKEGNFYSIGDLDNSDYNLVSSPGKKKKNRQPLKKKKNLFKGGE